MNGRLTQILKWGLLLEQNKNNRDSPSGIMTSMDRKPNDIYPRPSRRDEADGSLTPHGAESLLVSGFHELCGEAPGDDVLVMAFAFSLAARAMRANGNRCLCVCSAAGDAQERGELYGHGVAGLGLQPAHMLMIAAAKEKDMLWTLEDAIASGGFGAVVGSLGTKERLYGFAASRRLKLRAAASRTPLFLLRQPYCGGATAAHGRWRISRLPSQSEGEHAGYHLLGPPRLRLTLERMGGLPPKSWEMGFDVTGHFDMVSSVEDRPARKARQRRQAA